MTVGEAPKPSQVITFDRLEEIAQVFILECICYSLDMKGLKPTWMPTASIK